MVSRYLSAPDQRQDRHLPARSRASPSNWRGSARPLSAAPGGPSILSPVRPDQIVGVLIGRHRRDRGYAHHGRGGRSPNSPIRPTSRGTEVNGELRGQHAWVFWCSRSSDTNDQALTCEYVWDNDFPSTSHQVKDMGVCVGFRLQSG
jgi:hypothetical protein